MSSPTKRACQSINQPVFESISITKESSYKVYFGVGDEGDGGEARVPVRGVRDSPRAREEQGGREDLPELHRVRLEDGHQFRPIRVASKVHNVSLI